MGSNILVLSLRAAQLAMSVVVLGLSGYVASWYNNDMATASPGQINFLIFASLYSILSIVCLEVIPKFVPRASNPYVSLGVEFTNVVFWFAGFVSLAVFLSRLLFCRGSVCAAARADTAFGALLWILWTVTQVFLALDVFKSGFRRRGSSASGGSAAPGGAGAPYPNPSMKETMA
ncbi:membrane-associating domain-containing protein [Rhypophila decipiens]|uniref:Membrane-associating domain-containing protein n=1 Tax=Rhypophila decipiens TaxID=261697 RepID=A0AAN6YBI7_9PEZI|nr:membrane-associating domain-containing protein [Rhypophila decipiens]